MEKLLEDLIRLNSMLRMDNLLRWFPKAVSKLQDKIDLTNLLVSIK